MDIRALSIAFESRSELDVDEWIYKRHMKQIWMSELYLMYLGGVEVR